MPLPDLSTAETLEITFPMGRWTYKRRTWPSNDGRPVFEESPQRSLQSEHGRWELHRYFYFDVVADTWKRLRDDEVVDVKIVVTSYRAPDVDKGDNKDALGKLLLSREFESTKNVTIKLDGKVVMKAHKSILSATCPAWRNLLSSGMEDGKLGVIDIYNTKLPVLKAFVSALYSREPPKDLSILAPLAMMCDQYRCAELMGQCVHALEQGMKSDENLLRRTIKLVYSLEPRSPISRALQGAVHAALCHRMPPKDVFRSLFFTMSAEDEYKNSLDGLMA